MFALQNGGKAIFFRDRMHKVHDMLAAKGLGLERTTKAYSAVNGRLDPSLHDILIDAMGVSMLFNKHLDRRPLDLFGYQEALLSIFYRLLRFRSLQEVRFKPDLQSAHHIGMAVFMMTIFLCFDQRRIIKYELVSPCMKEVICGGLDEHEEELEFWLLMLGGIWASCDQNDGWFVSRLQERDRALGIETWDDARRILAKFPWIDVIHNEPGRELWDQVRCTGYRS